MATNTLWIKTHKALNDFFETLTCKKCQEKLENPKQFLNCGHFACAECIGKDTQCVYCKIPGEASDIYTDTTISDLLINLNIIANTVSFSSNNYSSKISGNQSVKTNKEKDIDQNVPKQKARKSIKNKSLDETLNTSIGESVTSKSTQRNKANKSIPKNIDKKNKKGETALHIACRSNNFDRVKILLEAGANPNTKDNAGWTPLQEAANYGYYEVCKVLLETGALPDMHGYDNRTALHEAVMTDDHNLAALLLNFNSNRKVYDNVGKKPRDYCKSNEMTNLFKSLQETVDNKSDTLSDTNKSHDFNKTLNTTISESKIILYGSDLSIKNRRLLVKLGLEKKLKVVNNFSPSVSHVIVKTDATSNIRLSLDVLLTILYGKWLINSDCLSILMDSDNVTPEDISLFDVNPPQLDDCLVRAIDNVEKQNPKLFNNCHFYFALKSYDSIHYDQMKLKKEDLVKLVAAGDGILLTREPRPEDIQGSLSPFHVAHNSKHSLHKCTHYVIYIPDDTKSNSNRIIYNMPTLKTLPLMWFIESILRFKLLDPIDLGLQPQQN